MCTSRRRRMARQSGLRSSMPCVWSAWGWLKRTPSSRLTLGVEQLLAQIGRGVDEDRGRAVGRRSARQAPSSGGGGSSGLPDRRRPTLPRPAARRRTSRSPGWSVAASMRRSDGLRQLAGGMRQLAKDVRSVLARVASASASGVDPARLGDHARRGDDEGRLVAAAAMGRRREIGRVGLDQNAVERNVAGDGAQILRLLERHHAGKRDREPEAERGLGELARAR